MKIFLALLTIISIQLSTLSAQPTTHLITLGTGTPNADPDRFGPATAIVVNDKSYVIDCGAGVVRRCAAAAKKYNLNALEAPHLNTLFITHLHSDHTIGYPDFILTPAVLERKVPLQVYGPKGIKSMTRHILKAYKEDIDIRVHGLENGDPDAYQVNVQEIKAGIIYRDSNLTVKAFPVKHGSWHEAYGYRFETKDKVIVISGDCTYSESLVENAKDCDILVHEVYSEEGFAKRSPKWQAYHSVFHTSTSQLTDIANKVNPKLLVLTHQLIWSSTEEKLLDEIRAKYAGKVISAHDLDEF
ncbi:MAG: MBL fold metallo-hydrolase [Saprospiraceae bacterium]